MEVSTKNDGINVRDFIADNYTPYDGDDLFLAPKTERTEKLWNMVKDLLKKESEKGVLDADEKIISSITSHECGYIDASLEQIVGLQTDKPLKRALMPFGGIRMAKTSLEAYGKEIDKDTENIFNYRKTHNDGVFDAYTDEMKAVRHSGIVTGLPDAYGRGRIIGDYRRVALYGTDKLIDEKKKAKANVKFCENKSVEDVIREREEISEQIRSLQELKQMANMYGFDISQPAQNFKEAVQWLYFAYLAAVKEQNGAAMSLGRVSAFLDIYAEKDLKNGVLTENEVQEIIDHFVIKLRLVRFLRTPSYDKLFSGDPTWVTEAIGGMCLDKRHMVTKTAFRMLHTLTNLGPSPEPNLTVLWSQKLPENFKKYCCKMSIDTSSIQYENDDIMLPHFGDDYGIACCVSAMKIGKQMQFFGARANLAKAMLYAINGGRDEISGKQIAPISDSVQGEFLDYDDVMQKFDKTLDWLAKVYVETLNVIHYMHDKYCYERIQMALHDEEVLRTMAGGIAGLSVVADSFSAIKHSKVKPIRNEDGLITSFENGGDFPSFGNNDDDVDEIACNIVRLFMKKLSKQKTYRNSLPTLSVLTITSNVVYGNMTGDTPDGRKHGEAFAPGANPMHNRDKTGSLNSMMSVAKIPYESAMDGISYTFSMIPKALGKSIEDRINNLSILIDGYMKLTGHHINVNVLDKDVLYRAMEHPEDYPQLTIRVSGYAVNFVKLPREYQLDVINRTFHEK